MSNYSEEDIKYMEEILNKIKNKKSLSNDDYYYIVHEFNVYDIENDNDDYYQYCTVLSKLNTTYVVTNWNRDHIGDIGSAYEYPIIVKDIKTEEVPNYKHTINLEDGSSYVIETNDPNL